MDDNHPTSKQPHHWSHGGPALKNGHYLLSTFGRYAISFLLGGLSAAFFLGGKSRDITELIEWKGHMNTLSNEWKGHVDTVLERMDRDGTNASRWSILDNNKQILANRVLIEDLQKKVEPIGTMQSKIERLERDVGNKK